MKNFEKYVECGSYHWGGTYGNWRRRSPRLHARYDVPIRFLKHSLALKSATGVDFGCGDGVMLYKLVMEGAQVTGVELSEDGIRLAQEKLARFGMAHINIILGTCTNVPLPDNGYDFISCIEVIEHLDEPEKMVSEAARLLKPGGIFVCTTPNRRLDQSRYDVRDPYHVQEFICSELEDVLRKSFKQVNVYGLYPRWLDAAYVNGTSVGLIDKTVRFGVKILTTFGLNPYTLIYRKNPNYEFDLLVAVAAVN